MRRSLVALLAAFMLAALLPSAALSAPPVRDPAIKSIVVTAEGPTWSGGCTVAVTVKYARSFATSVGYVQLWQYVDSALTSAPMPAGEADGSVVQIFEALPLGTAQIRWQAQLYSSAVTPLSAVAETSETWTGETCPTHGRLATYP